MKRLILILVAIMLIAWILTSTCASVFPWVWAENAVTEAALRPWPGELGSLDTVSTRYPPLVANDASRRFATLAAPVESSDVIDGFLRREIESGDLAIGEPPPLPEMGAIRDLLLAEAIVWERRHGVDDGETTELRGMSMRVARALVASALSKARGGDPAVWEDLRAIWNLSRALDPFPQMMMQTAALSMARWINAVAWKAPLPAPAWFAELQQRDFVLRMLEAFQYQVASYWNGRESMFPTKWLAKSIEFDRGIAETLFQESRGAVDAPMNELGVDLSEVVWRRAFRYRVEREATANALRVRAGSPIDPASRCSDGGWSFDGVTLRYSIEIPTTAPDMPMPLVLRITR
jgi:hypothetical protein